MTTEFSIWILLPAALGLWFLIEGLAYFVAPDSMKRFLDWAARLPVSEIRSAGMWTSLLGAILLYIAVRFM